MMLAVKTSVDILHDEKSTLLISWPVYFFGEWQFPTTSAFMADKALIQDIAHEQSQRIIL